MPLVSELMAASTTRAAMYPPTLMRVRSHAARKGTWARGLTRWASQPRRVGIPTDM